MEVTKQAVLRVLLISHDEATAKKVRVALTTSEDAELELVQKHLLSGGLKALPEGGIDAILLCLSLPDSNGIMTFETLLPVSLSIPVLILAEEGQEGVAKEAVKRGAQDYLLPGHIDNYSLPRALRNAIERKSIQDALYVEKERALVTLNSIGDAVLCTDIDGKITYLNAVAEGLTGWKMEEASGHLLAEVFRIIDGSTRKVARDPMQLAVELGGGLDR